MNSDPTMPPKARFSKVDLAIILGLIAWFLIIQTAFLQPPHIYDPSEYMAMARKLPDVQAHHRSLRIGLLIPTALAIGVFDYSEAAFYFMPYVGGAGLVVATYILGRLLFGRSIGGLAAAIIIANPYFLTWSSQLFPDVPAAAMLVGAVAALTFAGMRLKNQVEVPIQVKVALVTAGGLFAWGYLIREFILLFAPLLILIVWMYRIPRRLLGYFLIPTVSLVAMEWAWGWFVYGDPFIRMRVILGRTGSSGRSLDLIEDASQPLLDTILTFPNMLLTAGPGMLFVFFLVVLALSSILVRDRRFVVLSVWVFGLGLAFTLLVVAQDLLGIVILRIGLIRYWYPIFPALIIGGIGGTATLGTLLAKHPAIAPRIGATKNPALAHRIGMVATIVLTAVTISSGIADAGQSRNLVQFEADHNNELRDWLSTSGAGYDTIWTDQHTSWILPMYTRGTFGFGSEVWDGTVRSINNAKRFVDMDAIESGIVIFQDEFFRAKNSNWRDATPGYLISPPDSWSVVFVSENGAYVIFDTDGDANQDVLYEVGDNQPRSWQAIPRQGSTITEPSLYEGVEPHSLSLVRGDFVVLSDNTRRSMAAPPGKKTAHVAPGESIRVDVELGAEGNGWIEFVCWFYDTDGVGHRQIGSTGWGPPGKYSNVEYVCHAPADGDEPYRLRTSLEVRGPMDVVFGPLKVSVTSD